MGPYTHFILAARLASPLQPDQPGEYYWGSVVPDIRYLAGLPREVTHVSPEMLDTWSHRYPHLRSFILGYRVHCLIDQVDVVQALGHAFPINLLARLRHRPLSQAHLTLLVEMEYLRHAVPGAGLSASHNEVLEELGVTPRQSNDFGAAMAAYVQSHTIDAAFASYERLGMIDNPRGERYWHAYRELARNGLLMALYWLGIRNSHLEEHTLAYILSQLHTD